MEKKNAIIVDIDGTLANNQERRLLLEETKNWDVFNSSVERDFLNVWCNEVINKFKSTHKIILVTGRREICKSDTLLWLKQHQVDFDDIYFRGAEDFRKDEIVKEEIYNNFIKEKYNILFVIDDRANVVKMWRSLGLVCLQCDFGEF